MSEEKNAKSDSTRRGISRRTLAKGAAWATPAVAISYATPAFASSRCDTSITGTGGNAYNWGFGRDYTGPVDQLYKFTSQMTVTDLPPDAEITGLKIDMITENRNDGVTGHWDTNTAFDPGHKSASTRTAGTQCITNYANVGAGCDFTSLFKEASRAMSTNPTGLTLYRTTTPGRAWEPINGSSATIRLTSNWTDTRWSDGITRKSWTLTYTGDPRIANEMLDEQNRGNTGCKTFRSLDVPIFEVVYTGVQGPGHDRSNEGIPTDVIFTFSYRSGGQEHPLTFRGILNLP